MAIFPSCDSPGARIAVGDAILAAASAPLAAPAAKRLAAFKKIHAAYLAAGIAARKAGAALQQQQARLGEADVAQDEAILALAAALAADGLPRLNPFKPFGIVAPAAVCALGYAAEAAEVLSLTAAVLRRKGLSPATHAAARAAADAAKAVQSALAPIPPLEHARAAARARRDALTQPWETALAGLERSAHAAAWYTPGV